MTVLWVAQAVTVTNGQKEVIVTSAPGNAITKVETSATFHGVGFSLPYEIERTYNNGTNDVIVLYENWAGSSGSIGAVAAPSGAAVTRAANSLEELKAVYESIADSISTTVTANSIPQRDSNGRMKAAAGSASDDVVVKSQTGTAASKDITTSSTDSTSGRVMKVGDFGQGINATPPTMPDLDSPTTPSGLYLMTTSVTNAGSRPAGFNGYGSVHVRPYLAGQIIQDYISIENERATRWYNANTSSWTDWDISYGSGNTDFDTITMGVAKEKQGIARNSTVIDFEFMLSGGVGGVTGGTVSGTVTLFDAVSGATVATGVNLSVYAGISSDKTLYLQATGLTGLSRGRNYKFVSESAPLTIEVSR